MSKRSEYLEWPDYFMVVAKMSAQRSKDPTLQTGACIVDRLHRIVGIGYNGMPIGCSDDLLPWEDHAADELDTKYPYVCHAAMNAIMNQNVPDITGSVMYITRFPCVECVKLILQAGIAAILYLCDDHTEEESLAARHMLDLRNVTYRKFDPRVKHLKFHLNDGTTEYQFRDDQTDH